jgi:hypothetical protein
VRFGVHTGLQRCTTDELRSLWGRHEELGFEGFSIWVHCYAAGATIRQGRVEAGSVWLEAGTAHAAHAGVTAGVRGGSRV